MTSTSSEDVAAYQELVDRNARYFVGRCGAEREDLVQEGLIKVWENLRDGVSPTSVAIQNAMRDWIRVLRRQQGM